MKEETIKEIHVYRVAAGISDRDNVVKKGKLYAVCKSMELALTCMIDELNDVEVVHYFYDYIVVEKKIEYMDTDEAIAHMVKVIRAMDCADDIAKLYTEVTGYKTKLEFDDDEDDYILKVETIND